jgi:hypothetical protein
LFAGAAEFARAAGPPVDGRGRHVVQIGDIEGRETAIGQQHHVRPHRYSTGLFLLPALPFDPFFLERLLGCLEEGSMRHETVAPFIGSGANP